MKTHIKEKIAMLVMSDGAAMFTSFVFAIALGHQASFAPGLLCDYHWGFATFVLCTVIPFLIFDAYILHKTPFHFLYQTAVIGFCLFLSSLLSTFVFFFFRDTVPRAVFILFYLFSFCLIVSFRYIIVRNIRSSAIWRVLIVGDGKRSSEVAQLISSRDYLRTAVVGYVSDGPGNNAQVTMPRLGSIRDLVTIAQKKDVDQVIVATVSIDDELMKLLLVCMQIKIKVSSFRNVIEEITGKVPIDHLNDNWFILELSRADKRYFWYAKRSFDVAIACVGMSMALPLLPLVAVLIKLDSRGAVFYSQYRIGRGSRPFVVWKLRTMVVDADKNKVHWTTNNDDRITRVGNLIRKMRLDEVPQLINILKGEMSLIGPRPEAVSLVELYTKAIPYYPERHMVTPGITGWAQINYRYGNSIEDARQKLMYDFYYIKNRSIALDLMIFLRTIRIVLTGKGAM
jgi:exopolysaccharide biosynthesis polyprenyl glycosylphosphotransferase